MSGGKAGGGATFQLDVAIRKRKKDGEKRCLEPEPAKTPSPVTGEVCEPN